MLGDHAALEREHAVFDAADGVEQGLRLCRRHVALRRAREQTHAERELGRNDAAGPTVVRSTPSFLATRASEPSRPSASTKRRSSQFTAIARGGILARAPCAVVRVPLVRSLP